MCETSWRVANSGRWQRMRCNTSPLFTELPGRRVFSETRWHDTGSLPTESEE
jgi:hypothetical protein